MTNVINATERFSRNSEAVPASKYDGTWISLRSGGMCLLDEYEGGNFIKRLLAEVERVHPATERCLCIHWDDKSCSQLEIYHAQTGSDHEISFAVDLDGGHYWVIATPDQLADGGAA